MGNKEKKIITKSVIKENHKKENGDNTLAWVFLLCCFVFIIIICREIVNVIHCILLLVIPLIGVVVNLFYRKDNSSNTDALDDGVYEIRIAACVEKTKSKDYSDEVRKSYKYSVILACESYPKKSFNITYEEYEKCKIGDLYYVVIVNANKDMILQFRCDDYKLSKKLEKKLIVEKNKNPHLETYIEALRYAASADEYDTDLQVVDALKTAIEKFKTIIDYRDSNFQISKCKEKIYKIAVRCSKNDKTRNFAAETFEYLGDYKNSKSRKKEIENEIF